jgi:hypothetical protein
VSRAGTARNFDRTAHTLPARVSATASPADAGRPLTACEQAPCTEHGTLCDYHGDEPDRCPWCHATWAMILRTHFHSCEMAGTWRGQEAKGRVANASEMRRKAAGNARATDHSAHCPHLGGGFAETLPASGRPESGAAGTRGPRNRAGQRIGSLEVMADHGRTKRGQVIWRCMDHAAGRDRYLTTAKVIRLDRERLAARASE